MPPSPLQKLPADPAQLRLHAYTPSLLRQQVWTVASHHPAPAQPTLSSAVPECYFQAAGEQEAAAAAGWRSAGVVSLPRCPVQHRGDTRAGVGGHDSLTLVKRRHVAAGTRTTVLTEPGFPRQPASLCTDPFPWQRGAGICAQHSGSGDTHRTCQQDHTLPEGFSAPEALCCLSKLPARHSFGGELRRIYPGACGSERVSLCPGKDTSRAFSVQNEHRFMGKHGDSQRFGQPSAPAVGFPAVPG